MSPDRCVRSAEQVVVCQRRADRGIVEEVGGERVLEPGSAGAIGAEVSGVFDNWVSAHHHLLAMKVQVR
ncbi:hypothetical protein IFM12276_34550 [Nocardia sputorum]|uniref:Uncharacterized protein n=1 Tax=Nocardia sputorum TaxID=2984338 RepID=A0ABM8CZE8_9NOCA|nr:hypothetical protein IFM12276_34550 [Nocardia sputorum]